MPRTDTAQQTHPCLTDQLDLVDERSKEAGVAQRPDGQYEARFALELVAVAERASKGEPLDLLRHEHTVDDALMPALSALEAGQEIEIVYRWHPRTGGDRCFDMRLSGHGSATDRSRAADSARSLRQGLLDALGDAHAGHYEFAQLDDVAGVSRDPRAPSWQLARAGIVVPCASAQEFGFVAPAAQAAQVVMALPMSPGGSAFDSFLRAGIAGDSDLRLCIQACPMVLSARALASLEAAYRNLRTGLAGQVRFEEAAKGRIFDGARVGALLQQLERWLAEPRGYRLHCALHCPEPVSKALLTMLGGELYRGSALQLQQEAAIQSIARAADAQTVRLNDCLHVGETPANLVPSPAALRACGVPRSYRDIPSGLARQGMTLGTCGPTGTDRAVRLADADRDRHCYVIGATGTGKSTLLYNMVTQDIEGGAGLCLIDPHGDLHEAVLRSIPKQRADDVLLIDLSDFDYSVGLNFLECEGAHKDMQINFIVNEMLTIFDRLYDMKRAGGPVFETYMRNALLTVMDTEQRTATLLDVVRFFEDRRFRASATSRSKNAISVSFWNRQAAVAGGEISMQNIAPYITSKLNQFTHNALLRPIIGQVKSTVDFRRAMDEGRIVLVNLAKGSLGEFDMRLLGMLIIGKMFKAALGRSALPLHRRRLFHLYIDEFQTLATPTVIGLLSEARKFGLSLTMANQHLAQLSEGESARGVADAVLGNAATLLFFRVGPKDAGQLESFTLPELNAQDLQQLPDHHAACRLVSRNVPVRPFVLRSPPRPALRSRAQSSIVAAIRERARRSYLRPRATVDATIMADWRRGDEPRPRAQ